MTAPRCAVTSASATSQQMVCSGALSYIGQAQVQRDMDLAEFGLAPRVEARAGEDAEHRAVARHDLGVEAPDRA